MTICVEILEYWWVVVLMAWCVGGGWWPGVWLMVGCVSGGRVCERWLGV